MSRTLKPFLKAAPISCETLPTAGGPQLLAITPFGHFDATKGGHIVLWTLKLVVEFPAGSTALIPSAVVPHSNTPISKHEERCSFTQYSSGGTFRWVACDFKKADVFFSELAENDERDVEMERMQARCKLALSLFSTIDEIQEIHKQKSKSQPK